MRRRAPAAAIAALAAAGQLAACGGDDEQGRRTASTAARRPVTTVPVPTVPLPDRIDDAASVRDRLLLVAARVAGAGRPDAGALVAAFEQAGITARPATRRARAGTFSASQARGRPPTWWFVLRDVEGRCEGGAVTAGADARPFRPSGSACSADASRP